MIPSASIHPIMSAHSSTFVLAEDVMEMDIDYYFLERSFGFINDEQSVHDPAGEDFFQWYQGQLRQRIRWRQEDKSTAPRPRKEKRARHKWLTGMQK